MPKKVTEQQRVDVAIARKNADEVAALALDIDVWALLNTDIFKAATWEEAHEAIVALVKVHVLAAASTLEGETK